MMIRVLHPIPVDQLRLFVFDLDGTLIDSSADLAHSVNAMLRNFHLHELPEEVIASYIGDGASMLVRRALGDPDDEDFVHQALTFFLDYYREHKLDFTYVYQGIFPALDAIRALPGPGLPGPGLQGPARQLAVLTNKPVGPSRAICEALGLAPYFFQNYGGDSFHTKKPDPHGLAALIAEAGVTPAQTVMIGDSAVDVLTARNAGTWAVGCTFGLSSPTLVTAPPDISVDHPEELIQAFSF